MLKYIEAVQHYSRECVKELPGFYNDLTLERGLEDSEDLTVAWMLSAIYGRTPEEAEHDILVYIQVYENEND